jgi:hypothetical protein
MRHQLLKSVKNSMRNSNPKLKSSNSTVREQILAAIANWQVAEALWGERGGG